MYVHVCINTCFATKTMNVTYIKHAIWVYCHTRSEWHLVPEYYDNIVLTSWQIEHTKIVNSVSFRIAMTVTRQYNNALLLSRLIARRSGNKSIKTRGKKRKNQGPVLWKQKKNTPVNEYAVTSAQLTSRVPYYNMKTCARGQRL